MPDINHQNFEPFESAQGKHSALEADIEKLSKEVAEKRNLPEYKELSEKELVKEHLRSIIKPPITGGEKPVVKSQEPSAVSEILPDYLKDSTAEIKLQVEKLVDLVFHQGLEKTVKEAKKTRPFILDAFHDALSDKLYEELKKRKMI